MGQSFLPWSGRAPTAGSLLSVALPSGSGLQAQARCRLGAASWGLGLLASAKVPLWCARGSACMSAQGVSQVSAEVMPPPHLSLTEQADVPGLDVLENQEVPLRIPQSGRLY